MNLQKITKTKALTAFSLVLAFTAATPAFAAIDANIQAGITQILTAVSDLVSAIWPVVIAVAVSVASVKLFKKFTGKAI